MILKSLLQLETEMRTPLFLAPERRVRTLAKKLEKQIKARKGHNVYDDEWIAIPERMRALIVVAFLRAVQDHATKRLKKYER